MSWFYSPSFLLMTLLVVLPEHAPRVIVIFQFIFLFSDKTLLRTVAQYAFPVSGKLNLIMKNGLENLLKLCEK